MSEVVTKVVDTGNMLVSKADELLLTTENMSDEDGQALAKLAADMQSCVDRIQARLDS